MQTGQANQGPHVGISGLIYGRGCDSGTKAQVDLAMLFVIPAVRYLAFRTSALEIVTLQDNPE